MEQTRVILVDDNKDSLDILQFYIEQLPGFTILDTCTDGEQLLDSIMTHSPDVILLDINMPKMNGIDSIKECRRIRPELQFIFVTSYHQYAVEAFELSALDYVVKPLEKSRLYAALDRVKKADKPAKAPPNYPETQRLIIRDTSSSYFIPLTDILFVEKIMKKCYIYTVHDTFVTTETITSLLNQLPADLFFMSHRSYILNLAKLTSIKAKNQTYIAYFAHSEKYAHISKLKFDELQQRMNAFLL